MGEPCCQAPCRGLSSYTMSTRKHIVLAGGGTAGHVNPLLAVAQVIRSLEPDADIAVVGTAVGLEHNLVPQAGFQLETIEKVIGNYDIQVVGINRGYKRTGEADEAMKKEALDLAAAADIVLYCFGLDELSES